MASPVPEIEILESTHQHAHLPPLPLRALNRPILQPTLKCWPNVTEIFQISIPKQNNMKNITNIQVMFNKNDCLNIKRETLSVTFVYTLYWRFTICLQNSLYSRLIIQLCQIWDGPNPHASECFFFLHHQIKTLWWHLYC